MNAIHSDDYLTGLVRELCKLPHETEWVEFKQNDADPKTIGENISALANSAAFEGKASAYIVWGIRDEDHAVVGTAFDPSKRRIGNEELENWLLRLLEPKIEFRFFSMKMNAQPVVLLEISRSTRQPVRFQGTEFLRVGTYTKKLSTFPEKERALWRIFDQTSFEEGIAAEQRDDAEILRLLDYPAYFDLLNAPLPENRDGILSALAADNLIKACEAGGWNVTNLGAMLFARDLGRFPRLTRKAVRVIQYSGVGRIKASKERESVKGYANGFDESINFINGLLPLNEIIGPALRKTVPMFPLLAVRELVANALIHQDFFVTGTGPMVEIFEDRVEITNPGAPLVDTQRFLDTPPKSRNETLASLMRRFGICEERGSGIDKVVSEIELYQLPAPLFEAPEGFTRTVLFAYQPFRKMSETERLRACYLHACLKYVMRDFLTNTSLRKRFGIEKTGRSMVSRVIRNTVDANLVAPHDPDAAPKQMRYMPWWAVSEQR